MDAAVTNARKRKAELEAELVGINRFLADYDKFASMSDERSEPVIAVHVNGVASAVQTGTLKVKNRGLPEAVANNAQEIILAEGRPLTRSELVSRLEERGIQLPALDKERYVGTVLWRNKNRFENLSGKGYWVTGHVLIES